MPGQTAKGVIVASSGPAGAWRRKRGSRWRHGQPRPHQRGITVAQCFAFVLVLARMQATPTAWRQGNIMRIASLSLAKWLILAGILVGIALLLVPATQRIHWVGFTDLEIEFLVTDAVTENPIPGAPIKVQSEGGLCAEREKQRFSLVTDSDRSVRRLSPGCMCFGTSGWIIDTTRSTCPVGSIELAPTAIPQQNGPSWTFQKMLGKSSVVRQRRNSSCRSD